MKKYYTEEQVKEAYEIVYGHDEEVRYEYSEFNEVYMHSVFGSNYVDMSRHIEYLIRKGLMEI